MKSIVNLSRLHTSKAYSKIGRQFLCFFGLTENDGHENDGPSKFQDMKLQDVKMQDMKLQDMKLEDKQRKSNNRDYIRMQFL